MPTSCPAPRLALKLGIAIERIQRGQPQQNGRHERMHLTLKKEAARPACERYLCLRYTWPAVSCRRQRLEFRRDRTAYQSRFRAKA